MSSEKLPTNVGERIHNFLRARHPIKTADHVAAMTGCSLAQARKWMERLNVPNGVALLRLTSAYGPEFLAAVLGDHAPRWLDDAYRAERHRELDARMRDLESQRSLLREELRAVDAR